MDGFEKWNGFVRTDLRWKGFMPFELMDLREEELRGRATVANSSQGDANESLRECRIINEIEARELQSQTVCSQPQNTDTSGGAFSPLAEGIV